MNTNVRSYLSARTLLWALLPAMCSVVLWPLAWLGLHGSQGLVLFLFFAMLLSVGIFSVRWESLFLKELISSPSLNVASHLLLWSSRILQFLSFFFFFAFSLWCLWSILLVIGTGFDVSLDLLDTHHGQKMGMAVAFFLQLFFFVLLRKASKSRFRSDPLVLFMWVALVSVAFSVLLYNVRLPLFAESLSTFLYPNFWRFQVSELWWLFGLTLFSVGLGWGLRPFSPRGRRPGLLVHRSLSLVLWIFIWLMLVGFLIVPFIFRLNFATSGFDTLFLQLPQLFLGMPAGIWLALSILWLFYLSSMFISFLIVERGSIWWWSPHCPAFIQDYRKWFYILLVLGLLMAIFWWPTTDLSWMDGFFAYLTGLFYPIHAIIYLSWRTMKRMESRS